MVPTGPDRRSASGWRKVLAHSKPALPLSIALHLVLVYSVSRMSWVAAEIKSRSPTTVVWLNDWPPAEEAAPELEEPRPVEIPAPSPQNAPAPAPEEPPVVAVEPPTAVPEPTLDDEAPETDLTTDDADAAAPATAPDADDRERSYFVPGIDWERERREAAARVLEQRDREEGYRTFSLDDVPEGAPREQPSPPTAIAEVMKDKCRVVSGRLTRFAMQMLGQCVREARGDLFADIKPAYLRNRPLCAESRPGQPPIMDARGNEISSVKCRLVDDDEYAAISTNE